MDGYLQDGNEIMAYARKAAWQFARQTGMMKLVDDFIGEAAMAVLDALEKADETRNVRGYVATYVMGRMRNYLRHEYGIAQGEVQTEALESFSGHMDPEPNETFVGIGDDASVLLQILQEQPEDVVASMTYAGSPKSLLVAAKKALAAQGWTRGRIKAAEQELIAVVA